MTKNNEMAVIFDMDGVIIDNAEFHYLAWETFCGRGNHHINRDELRYWFGNTNQDILERVYGRKVSLEESLQTGEEKEKIYRELISQHLVPVTGLVELLEELTTNDIPVALATSAPPENVEFILGGLKIKQYFDQVVDATGVSRGKPFPEIYLKASRLLDIPPERCLVFEDALLGIEAANRAGMRVIGIITTLKKHELNGTVLTIQNFTEISVGQLKDIVNGPIEELKK